MKSRNDVIRGLECCKVHGAAATGELGIYCGDECPTECPYSEKDDLPCYCLENLVADAIALLKAQEPRVMTPQDFDGNPMKDQYGNLPCWLESREPLVASNWCRWNEDDFIRPMMRNFRPWTSRPTDEQREATPWP